jgi:signal transduction histidine kinase
MKLRTRIALWYALVLVVAISIVAIANVIELHEQMTQTAAEALAEADEGPLDATLEMILYGVLPALAVGLVGGAIITRRALSPLAALTTTLEQTNVGNLGEAVASSGNGDEIDRLAHVFNELKQRLALSFAHAREFTLHASHELKTPLTIIHSSLEQLHTNSAAAPAIQEHCGNLIEEVQRLSTIVGQLAFLARADAGEQSLTLSDVPLHELVIEAGEDAAHLAAANDISVMLEPCAPCVITADRMRLRQLLVILVDNAVKHNQLAGQLFMSLRADNERFVELTVANTAPVDRSVDASRVFQRFYRGDAAHGVQSEGSGLGLSIAQTIVTAHRGSITFGLTASGLVEVQVKLPVSSQRSIS